mmetsp:Transcript_25885/g.56396  ORF Transcript_25885/g.56396 Transcript_25885/m.56396 type:complete len:206 (-) Transcript_25885:1665-2282(-)
MGGGGMSCTNRLVQLKIGPCPCRHTHRPDAYTCTPTCTQPLHITLYTPLHKLMQIYLLSCAPPCTNACLHTACMLLLQPQPACYCCCSTTAITAVHAMHAHPCTHALTDNEGYLSPVICTCDPESTTMWGICGPLSSTSSSSNQLKIASVRKRNGPASKAAWPSLHVQPTRLTSSAFTHVNVAPCTETQVGLQPPATTHILPNHL